LHDDADLRSKPLKHRFQNQFSTFFAFVVFSGIVWMVIKLSSDFTSTVTYKVEYENLPVGQILVNASDSNITVGLDARGFDLVNYHLWEKRPVVNIDLAGIRLQQDDETFTGYLLTSGLTRKLALQVGSHNELLFISPDTLKFWFKPEHRKKVPVTHMVQYQMRPQFMLYDSVQIFPDSIWIFGPMEIVDTIYDVRTSPRTFPDLFEDQKVILGLQKPSNLPLTYSTSEVEVSLRVEKFTEKAFELPININCPKSELSIRIFPETVTLHCQVALKDYRRIDPGMFKAAVSCHPGEMQASTKLRVEITDFPSYVRIARIEPERVEYIFVRSNP
jgi:hypothetical protein